MWRGGRGRRGRAAAYAHERLQHTACPASCHWRLRQHACRSVAVQRACVRHPPSKVDHVTACAVIATIMRIMRRGTGTRAALPPAAHLNDFVCRQACQLHLAVAHAQKACAQCHDIHPAPPLNCSCLSLQPTSRPPSHNCVACTRSHTAHHLLAHTSERDRRGCRQRQHGAARALRDEPAGSLSDAQGCGCEAVGVQADDEATAAAVRV